MSADATDASKALAAMPLDMLVDTVILRALLLGDQPIVPFLQTPNKCNVAECEVCVCVYLVMLCVVLEFKFSRQGAC